jgi:hypothetical protein
MVPKVIAIYGQPFGFQGQPYGLRSTTWFEAENFPSRPTLLWSLLEAEKTSSIISAILKDDRNRTLDMKLVLSVPPIRLWLNPQQLKHTLEYVTSQSCEIHV